MHIVESAAAGPVCPILELIKRKHRVSYLLDRSDCDSRSEYSLSVGGVSLIGDGLPDISMT